MSRNLAAPAPRRAGEPAAAPGWTLVGPLGLVLAAWFFIPTILLLVTSFHPYTAGQTSAAWTLENYGTFFTRPFFRRMLWRTIELGAATGGLAVVIAYPVAHMLVRSRSRWQGVVMTLTFVPLLGSVVVSTYAWLVLLGDHGLVNTILVRLAIVHQPLHLVYNFTGVLIGLVHAVLPYAILTIAASLQGVDPILERAAMNLGAGPVRTFLAVTLPLSLPGIAAGFLLAFAASLSAYVVPKVLGGGFLSTTGTEIYDQVLQQLDWPLGATIAAVVLVSVVVSLTLVARFRGGPRPAGAHAPADDRLPDGGAVQADGRPAGLAV